MLEVLKCCIALDTSCQGVDVYQGLELYKDTVQNSMELIKRLETPMGGSVLCKPKAKATKTSKTKQEKENEQQQTRCLKWKSGKNAH